MKTKFGKRLSILVSLIIVLNSFLVPYSISFAEDQVTQENQSSTELTNAESPSTETAGNSTPPPETQSTQTTTEPSSTEPAAETDTGDATAQAVTNNDINSTQTQTDGLISAGGCDVDGSVGCPVNSENTAEVSSQTTADANTGINSTEEIEGDAVINTGDALSQSITTNQANTNVIEATDLGEVQTENLDKTGEPDINLSNQAEIEATNSAQSTSGQNESNNNQGTATINTGDSIAEANQANIVNTNIIGSSFEFFVKSIIDEQTGDINLNDLWKLLMAQPEIVNSAELTNQANLLIAVLNEANLNLFAQATAISGQNQANNNQGASINTGDSIAVANIFNLVNTNIIGSQFLFGVINIFGSLIGNIILPSQERILEALASDNQLTNDKSLIETYNQAYVTANVLAQADSGSNSQTNENVQTLSTGNAVSQAGIYNFINLNLFLTNWFSLILNNFGFWQGTVDGWFAPDKRIVQDEESATYSVSNNDGQPLNSQSNNNSSLINLENVVNLNAKVEANAISGQNSTSGNWWSKIVTGQSLALANLFNLLNLNIIGGKFFLPVINILGGIWKGNLIFAYPDLIVNISADKEEVKYGDNLTYTVSYENIGYEEARNAVVEFDLPDEATVVSASYPSYTQTDHHMIFNLGTVPSKASGSFTVNVIIEKGNTAKADIFSRLATLIIKPVNADSDFKELVAIANMKTTDPESDLSKNSSSVTTYLITEAEVKATTNNNNQEEETVSTDLPILTVTASNNMGEFVYPGDVLTFFVDVKNTGRVTSKDTVVYQEIYFSDSLVGSNKFLIGDIGSNAKGKLTFGMQVPYKAPTGEYVSVFYAVGRSLIGELVQSESTQSYFKVKSNLSQSPVKFEGEVLAAAPKEEKKITKPKNNYYLYLLILAMTLLWYVEYIRRRTAEEKLELLLKKLQSKGTN